MDIKQLTAELEADVKSFMDATGQKISFFNQMRLVGEEAIELVEAANALSNNPTVEAMEAFLKEAADVLYVVVGANVVGYAAQEAGELAGLVPSDDDMKNIFLLTLSEDVLRHAGEIFMSDDVLLECFKRVHASNMSKLGDDGKAIFSPEGKVLKGPNYQKPTLTDLAEAALPKLILAKEEFEDIDEDEDEEDLAA